MLDSAYFKVYVAV